MGTNILRVGNRVSYWDLREIAAMLPKFEDYVIEEGYACHIENENGEYVHVSSDWAENFYEVFMGDDEIPSNLWEVDTLLAFSNEEGKGIIKKELRRLSENAAIAFAKAMALWEVKDGTYWGLDRLAWAYRRLMIRKIERTNWLGLLMREQDERRIEEGTDHPCLWEVVSES